MSTQSSSLIQRYRLSEEILPDLIPKPLEIGGNIRYVVSIYALDFAIIHRIEHVINFVINWYKGTETLSTPTTSRKLSPLHIAVITGHEEAVKKLIAAGAHLNAQDKAHWTPLHHAALIQSTPLMDILINAGASQTSRSITGGTYRDVLNCLEPVEKDSSTVIALIGEVSDRMLTHGEFKQLTKAVYVNETHLTPELMLDEWNSAEEPRYEFPFEEKYASQYSDFIKNPLIHQLKQVTHDSGGQKLVSSPGYGLYAWRSLIAGEMIGEYKGLFSDASTVTEYSLAYARGMGINGLEYRNEIPHINDGFINVVLIPGRGIGGLSTRDLFVTADCIKKGEQFCWNYAFNPPLKLLAPYAELRPVEARVFIKSQQIKDLVKCLEKVGNRTSTFEEYVKAEKFRYLLQTPSVIFLMILDRTITSNQGKRLLTLALDMKCILPEEIPDELKNLPKLAQSCLDLKEALTIRMPFLVQKYDELTQSLPGQVGLLFSLLGIEKINMQIQKLLPTAQSENVILPVWDELVRNNMSFIKTSRDYFLDQVKKSQNSLV